MVVRTSISLPDALKAEMDAAGADVNWSAEAAKCFRLVLGQIAAYKERKEMSDVIARLRASKIGKADAKRAEARAAGQEWARSVAEYDELEVAASLRGADCCAGEPDAPYGHADLIAFDILRLSKDDRDESQSDDFWASAKQDRAHICMDREFLEAFLDGAGEVFDLVESSL